jgi:hypothetical protein
MYKGPVLAASLPHGAFVAVIKPTALPLPISLFYVFTTWLSTLR